MIYIWIAIVLFLSLLEIMTSKLISIWFSISGIFVIISSIFIDNYIIRLLIFLLGGLILLTIFRPLLLKNRGEKNE